MHSSRWARMMSNTVLPLMIESSKCMASPIAAWSPKWDRTRCRDMACRGRRREDGGPWGTGGNDQIVGIVFLDPARHSAGVSRRADAHEDIIKRVKIGADLSRRELVVRLHGVQISVLVRPVGVRNGGTEFLHFLQAGLQESAGVVTVLDLHHRGTDAPEGRLVSARDIGGDHPDEPQADQVSEGCGG